MKEQIYEIEDIKSFEPKQVFECGQCFRWNAQPNGSYTGVFGKNVLNVKKINNKIIFQGICDDDIEKICINYFDLNRDYEEIKRILSRVDENLAKSISYGEGIRLLNQDLWETLISFIISANNNIPRIKKIIENLSKKYGKEIVFQGKSYYTFPSPEELKDVTINDYREVGLGFRDKYVKKTTQMILEQQVDLEEISRIDKTDEIKEKLMEFPGVGEKVADCILLFSNLKRLDAFPIDVWVRRVMKELYFPEEDEKSLNKRKIQELAYKKYKNLAGIAQQYLFYWKRKA